MGATDKEKLLELVSEGLGIYQLEIRLTPEGSLAAIGSRNNSIYQNLPKLHQEVIELIVDNFLKSVQTTISTYSGVERVRFVKNSEGEDVLDAKIVEE